MAGRLMEGMLRGYAAAAPGERAGFGMLSAFAGTVAVARAVNYGRERRRSAPTLRSFTRRAYHAPGSTQPRIHHFLPGMALSFIAGAAAIVTHDDGKELSLSILFGIGAGLVGDEIGLLIKANNPYWSMERLALAQSALAAAGAGALAIRFRRRGAHGMPPA